MPDIKIIPVRVRESPQHVIFTLQLLLDTTPMGFVSPPGTESGIFHLLGDNPNTGYNKSNSSLSRLYSYL